MTRRPDGALLRRGLPDTAITETAPAKINLALHVTGQRADGYHLLDSLVTFARDGDRLTMARSPTDRFSVSGRFSALLSTETHDGPADNLVVKARDLLRQALTERGVATPPVAIHLEKNLPIASGIGGGSADAAATLRGLCRLWDHAMPEADLQAIALTLGADVPMCLRSQPLRAAGIGEDITPLTTLPAFALVLGNPLKGVSTPEIFRRLSTKANPPIGALPDTTDRTQWLDTLSGLRNDLQPPARALCTEIAELSGLLEQAGARLVRMSGSGATCFGIFDDLDAARHAAAGLLKQRPDWYFHATETMGGAHL
ncbi:4-(cytidine 5'-diphospho)-2-C-methyl-D-erythritol kinase [Agrobacterium sp. a22-2]|uniref:4-(cytidine 5'-diphospho)-2-C-methyl-D-erythritol kinase n=1 Tax=Agrobacterium sp. a22-2 TaxID=2283840 RepID=UPI0014465CD4|nr:4-(cytidine 5'-diphospho)-2-C-methyl-D-erythritol kinase [Agrobacterium sp. a22-2]NKN38520.1 4-(cytidine 5'-diphospho)-2-C-methyl-D-erythritol kinase [Agrobacterium sp. a22-2]